MAAHVANHGGTVPDGHHVTATCVADPGFIAGDDECLWKVAFITDDPDSVVFGGVTTILGPDGKEFEFPDTVVAGEGARDFVVEALTYIYMEDVADLLDPNDFSEDIAGILAQTERAISAIAEAARRGELSQEVWSRARSQSDMLVTDALCELAYRGPGMNAPLLDRLKRKHPATSSDELQEAIDEASLIGLQALKLTQEPHDRSEVLEELGNTYPNVYPRIWPRLYLRATYWWQWEI